ncbi:hypothetical protein ACFSCW_16615 [Sphingomonas tabacisoli]|uniref:Uncharacterized protein n=1 Tax=Sphingomonas tabacisoli TaxID=2249466 RepID=A0ABW4I808_9SPHN
MGSHTELAAELEKAITNWWDAHQSPILLSKLGGLLSSDIQARIREEKVGLKRFLAEELPQMRVLALGRHGGGVAPADKIDGQTDQEITANFEARRRRELVDRIPSYDRSVWQAFRTRIEDGVRRFLRVQKGEKVEALEVSPEESPPPGEEWIEITPADLQHLTLAAPSARDIHNAIQSWARGRLDPTLLERAPEIRSAYTSESPARSFGRVGTLESVVVGLKGFTRDELARIQVPADVLLSLLERSRRDR